MQIRVRGEEADKFMRLGRKACVPALQILIAQLSRRLVKFALKFSLNLRLIKFDRALARFGRRGSVNLTATGLRF